MSHFDLQMEKMSSYLWSKGYSSIKYYRESDQFQNMIILRACFIHSYNNKVFFDNEPIVRKKVKEMIDFINLRHFIKHPRDKITYNL